MLKRHRPLDPDLPLPPVRQVAPRLVLQSNATTDAGKRLVNEDAYFAQTHPAEPEWLDGLFIVADGIGGRGSGHIASALAVRAAMDTALASTNPPSPVRMEHLLEECFVAADQAVHSAATNDSLLLDMGTTLVVAIVAERRLFVASLGDSRAYLHRGRRLERLTEDDWVRTVAASGEDSAQGQNVTMVTQAVGWGEKPVPRFNEIEIGVGDILLFCTDGLTDGLTDREIERTLHANRRRLDLMIRRLRDGAGRVADADNITAVVARVDSA